MKENIECDVLIVGAGVIGLAIANEIAPHLSTVLIDSYPSFGNEISSRNSEVIHSGIYYPKDSLKTRWCIQGREKLYTFCKEQGVPHSQCGKLLVAVSQEEEFYLDKLKNHCKEIEVPCEVLSQKEISTHEPSLKVHAALFFPRSGIIDSHRFMATLENAVLENQGILAYRHKALSFTHNKIWETEVLGPEENLQIQSPWVINASGLGACEIRQAALQDKTFEHHFCRGRYFVLNSHYQNFFRHLIYPVPPKDGLGIHVTIDTEGFARLGPDVDWCEKQEYSKVSSLYDCEWEQIQDSFAKAARRYCPEIQNKDLSPGLIGIRPKLFYQGKAHPDFVVEEKKGFISCLGIESPGLTSALPLARHVASIMNIG